MDLAASRWLCSHCCRNPPWLSWELQGGREGHRVVQARPRCVSCQQRHTKTSYKAQRLAYLITLYASHLAMSPPYAPSRPSPQ